MPTPTRYARCLRYFPAVLCLLLNVASFAQEFKDSHYRHQGVIPFTTQSPTTPPAPLTLLMPPVPAVDHRVQPATAEVKLDAGEVYTFGNIAFEAAVTFNLVTVDATGGIVATLCNNCRLAITPQKPTALYTGSFAGTGSNGLRLTVSSVTVNVTDAKYPTQWSAIRDKLLSALRVTGSYVLPFEIDWQKAATATVVQMNNLQAAPLGPKLYRFSWQALFSQQAVPYLPAYQVQVLRLYNQQDLAGTAGLPADLVEKLKSEQAVRTTLDWSKALTLVVEGGQTTADLTVAEGTGFYAWRVRPMGTFAAGGAANARNFGPWSTAESGATAITFERNVPKPDFSFFYYQDVDDKLNAIYSRTFTEGNRVSEKISYASPLQQTRQTQAHLPSQKSTAISQTIYDHSNRPALSTLPVPVETPTAGGLPGYQKTLVRPDNGQQPYKAEHFDETGNLRQPQPLEQDASSAFNYYSGVKSNVPDAEGYPFTRSLYYNDGTDRMREQSGVGKTHAVGPQGSGMGRTVKTLYGTASEPELIRLFGDEAPDASSVIKTITIDQNETATVTYTSKEGKVLATCLSYKDQSGQGLLAAGAPDPITITDVVNANVRSGTGLVASKRLALLDETTLTVDYQLAACADPTNLDCYSMSLVCNYDLWVYIKKVDGVPFASTFDRKTWKLGDAAADGTYTVLYQDPKGLNCTNNTTASFAMLTLPAGTYVVEKFLVPRSAQTQVELAKQKVEAQITPLANFIKNKLATVKCDQDINAFYQSLKDLQVGLANAKVGTDPEVATKLAALDNTHRTALGIGPTEVFFTKLHTVTLEPNYDPAAGIIPKSVSLSSSCCTNLKIPIAYVPVFDFTRVQMQDITGSSAGVRVNPFLYVENAGKAQTEFLPDFEGYAYNFFWNCTPPDAQLGSAITAALAELATLTGKTTTALQTEFNASYLFTGNADIYTALGVSSTVAVQKLQFIYFKILAPSLIGWESPGTFNLMVQHMLKDKYSCNGVDKNGVAVLEPPPAQANECGTAQNGTLCATGGCPYYKPEALFKCWVAQLSYLQNKLGLCPNIDKLVMTPDQEPPYKVSQKVDEEKGGDEGFHDNHFDGNVKGGWLTKFFLKRKIKKISKRIRRMQDPNYADGGDGGDALDPRENLSSVKPNYHLVQEFLNCSGYRFAGITATDAPALTQPTYAGSERAYTPNENWRVILRQADGRQDTLFKYIKDPVYAFKFFHYKAGTKPMVELATCYSDPNKNAAGALICNNNDSQIDDNDLCNFCGIGRIRCDVTKDQWSCGQRYTFYATLNQYRDQPYTDWSDGDLRASDYASPGYVTTNATTNTKVFVPWQAGQNAEYTAATYQQQLVPTFTTADRLRTKVEIDITDLNRGLKDACEGKRPLFAKQLEGILRERCYVIGGCKTNANDNVIPEEDFNLLVDLMVEECKKRGEVNTYRTNFTDCVDYTKRNEIGYPNAFSLSVTTIEYGVFEVGETNANCQTATVQYRNTNTGGFEVTATPLTTTPLQATRSTDGTALQIYNCQGAAGAPVTYSQWLKRREVYDMQMRLVINLPPKCDGNLNPPTALTNCPAGTGTAAMPADPNVRNNTAVSTINPTTQPKYVSPGTPTKVDIDLQNKVQVNGLPRN